MDNSDNNGLPKNTTEDDLEDSISQVNGSTSQFSGLSNTSKAIPKTDAQLEDMLNLKPKFN
jgi:hypothetical protein